MLEGPTDPIRSYCASLQQPSILADMPKALFDPKTADVFAQHVQSTQAPLEKYRTTVFALFGSLLRRLVYVRRSSSHAWYSYDPDAVVGPGAPAANT